VGRALYETHDASELEAFGFTEGDFSAPVDVWPENWPIFTVFNRLQTQWIVGMGGPTGLSYPSAYPLLYRMTDDPQEWDQLLCDLQVLEAAALEQIRKKA
jgi:hypothetical protein